MKLKLKLDDQHTRAVWETVKRAKDEVAGWPAWKRGEASASTIQMDSAPTDSTAMPPPTAATKR